MVKFKIADDDEEEGSADTQLLPQSATDTSPGANIDTSRVWSLSLTLQLWC